MSLFNNWYNLIYYYRRYTWCIWIWKWNYTYILTFWFGSRFSSKRTPCASWICQFAPNRSPHLMFILALLKRNTVIVLIFISNESIFAINYSSFLRYEKMPLSLCFRISYHSNSSKKLWNSPLFRILKWIYWKFRETKTVLLNHKKIKIISFNNGIQ